MLVEGYKVLKQSKTKLRCYKLGQGYPCGEEGQVPLWNGTQEASRGQGTLFFDPSDSCMGVYFVKICQSAHLGFMHFLCHTTIVHPF